MESEIKKKPTRISIVLAQQGLKQKDLVRLCDLETCQVSNIVSGKVTNISLATAKKIAKALNSTLDAVFGDDN